MENTILIVIFFSLKKMVEEDMTRNKKSMLFVTELLTTGTYYLPVALIVISLTLLRSISRLN